MRWVQHSEKFFISHWASFFFETRCIAQSVCIYSAGKQHYFRFCLLLKLAKIVKLDYHNLNECSIYPRLVNRKLHFISHHKEFLNERLFVKYYVQNKSLYIYSVKCVSTFERKCLLPFTKFLSIWLSSWWAAPLDVMHEIFFKKTK